MSPAHELAERRAAALVDSARALVEEASRIRALAGLPPGAPGATELPEPPPASDRPRRERFVYVAGPLTTRTDGTSEMAHVRQAVKAAALIRMAPPGQLVPFVPHLSVIWEAIEPASYETWMQWCLAWVSRCDAVVRLPGESGGADREVELAEQLRIPVVSGNLSPARMLGELRARLGLVS